MRKPLVLQLVQSQHPFAQGQKTNNSQLQRGAMFVPEHDERLSLNLESKPDGNLFIALHDVYNAWTEFLRKANGATPPSMDVLSKLITRLFDIQPMHVCTRGEKRVLFKNLGPRTTNICNTVNIPSVCKIQSLEPNLTFKCPLPVLIDNIQQNCLVTFEKK